MEESSVPVPDVDARPVTGRPARAGAPRVLMFCPQFLPRLGGTERQVEMLSSALLANGLRIEIITPRFERSWPPEEEIRGVPVHRFPFVRSPRLFGSLRGPGVVASVWNGVVIDRLVRSIASRFDVLHAHNASSPVVAVAIRAAHRAGLRTVVSAVSSGDWFDLSVLRKNLVWGSTSARWLHRHVDLWLAKSAAIGEHLAADGVERLRIASLPNGVVLPTEARQLPEVASRFLYLGRLATSAPRDLSGLIESFENAEIPEGELALVGDGDQLERIRARSASSPLSARIHVPGQQNAQRWLSWAHCLVQPSYVEGLSNAVLEGMAAGLPCVAYDIAPNREVLAGGSAGILIPVGDRGALASALRELAMQPGLTRLWGSRARMRAEEAYDLRQVSQTAARIYEHLLEQRGSSPACGRPS